MAKRNKNKKNITRNISVCKINFFKVFLSIFLMYSFAVKASVDKNEPSDKIDKSPIYMYEEDVKKKSLLTFLFQQNASPVDDLAGKRNDSSLAIRVDPTISMSCSSLLLTGTNEHQGFGLYSYILIPRRPSTQTEHQRYLKLYKAFSRSLIMVLSHSEFTVSMPSIDLSSLKYFLNMTYWPIINSTNSDEKKISEENEIFFIENYDYMRSKLILSKFKELKTPGPFIISNRFPINLSEEFRVTDEILIIDLTRIDEDFFSDVIVAFLNMVKDRESWNRMFSMDLIRIHFISALKIHCKPAIDAAEWLSNFIKVKEVQAQE